MSKYCSIITNNLKNFLKGCSGKLFARSNLKHKIFKKNYCRNNGAATLSSLNYGHVNCKSDMERVQVRLFQFYLVVILQLDWLWEMIAYVRCPNAINHFWYFSKYLCPIIDIMIYDTILSIYLRSYHRSSHRSHFF